METKYEIEIPKPCHENWNQMTPDATGKFCGSCAKNVIDFTKMNTQEIQDYFLENQGKMVCGRFKNEQLDSLIIKIPNQVLFSQVSFHKMFMLALLVAMGTTLLSCHDENGNKQKINSVEVVQDTINHDDMLLGEIRPYTNDSLQIPLPPKPKIDETKFVKPICKKSEVNTIEEYNDNEISGMIIATPVEDIKDSIK